MKDNIHHIWFDLQGTLTTHTKKWETAHEKLLHATYAEVTGKEPTEATDREYDDLYKLHGTHSATFRSLGMPSDFWQEKFNTLRAEDPSEPDERIYGTLRKLKDIVPISIFTNASQSSLLLILGDLNIDPKWFTYLLNGDDVAERKPALDGFRRMVELSKLPADQLLYVGDRVKADIIPSKTVGMKTALVWSQSDEADYSFESFDDLMSLVD